MKILFVHQLAGFQGGAEANVHQVATALAARGHDVGLVYDRKSDDGDLLSEEFLEAFSFQAAFGESASDAAAALERARDWGAEVVYVHKLDRIDALELLVESGMPLVRMVHDHDMYCQRSSRYFPWNRKICTRKAGYGCLVTCGVVRNRGGLLPVRFEWPGEKLRELEICRRFALHIVQTDYMKRELLLHDFDEGGIRVLPVAPQESRIPRKARWDGKEILYVGQILRGKGVDFLLRSLVQLESTDWHCTIAGDGNYRQTCETLSRQLGLAERVSFVGRVDRERLAEIYEESRVGVVPSVWPEPMGMVGLEFMWAGLPVVGFDAGGIGDWLVNDKSGVLVPSRDIAGLARGIDRLLSDDHTAERMGREGQRIAKARYGHGQYVEALEEILAGVRPADPTGGKNSQVPVGRKLSTKKERIR